MQSTFDAIVLAGYDRDRPDEFTTQMGQPHKALIDVNGRPMVWHVVHALAACAGVARIFVIGLSEADGVDFGHDVLYLPDQGGMLTNAAYAFEILGQDQDQQRHALLLTADIPLLRQEMIAWFLDACRPHDADVYWGIVERTTMEAAFPNSRRSYLRLVEGRFCSGDLYLGRIHAALNAQGPIKEMIDNRKNVLKQVRILGVGMLFRYLVRRLRLEDVLVIGERLLGMQGQAVILPYAEIGMDVDKPHQYRQVAEFMHARPDRYPPETGSPLQD